MVINIPEKPSSYSALAARKPQSAKQSSKNHETCQTLRIHDMPCIMLFFSTSFHLLYSVHSPAHHVIWIGVAEAIQTGTGGTICNWASDRRGGHLGHAMCSDT